MIYFRFNGRMGNQMFQYACANELAAEFKTMVFWDDVNGNSLFKYFSRNKWRHIKASNRATRKLFRIFLKLIYRKQIPLIVQTGSEPVNDIKKKFANPGVYDGFFQSEDYFTGIQPRIAAFFKIKKRYQTLFYKKYGNLFIKRKVLAIHCRLGDYIHWERNELGGKDFTLPITYYNNAIKLIEDIADFDIVIVTDDIPEAKKRFSDLKNYTIISDEEIIDFQVLMNADRLIISNSSFSWWAAYLNSKSTAIYAPEFWIGFKIKKEWPLGIIPHKFITVPVY